MHDRARDWHFMRRMQLVVIGDDELEPDLARVLRLMDRRHSAVDGHDRLDPLAAQRVERLAVQSVALCDPVRHIGAHRRVRRDRPQHVPEDRRRHDAVDVVVAVDRDALACAQRVADGLGRLSHVVHGIGVLQLLQIRSAERLALVEGP